MNPSCQRKNNNGVLLGFLTSFLLRLGSLSHEKSHFCLPTKVTFFNDIRSCKTGDTALKYVLESAKILLGELGFERGVYMKREYTFFDGGTLEFDDRKSVKELIAYAFNRFELYEPLGMDCVTLFQAHHPDTSVGWFTTDVTLSCAEEIKNPDELCFAYHMPNVFYFAEGGWGHHMKALGNRPSIDNEVALSLRFEDFNHTVIVNGKYTFTDVIGLLKRTEYIDGDCRRIKVIPIGCADKAYVLSVEDPITKVCLSEFDEMLDRYNAERIRLNSGDFIYNIDLQIF